MEEVGDAKCPIAHVVEEDNRVLGMEIESVKGDWDRKALPF